MYKVLIIIIGFFLISSCSNEFDLNEKWKEIPVTYGILNPKDTAQYIRLERVFNDPNTPAIEVALNPDSLYYENISLELIRESNNSRYILSRIDGNTDGHVRDSGIFANIPNYLYKIKTVDINLKAGEKYSLLASKENGDTLAHATIPLVQDIKIYLPSSTDKPVKLGYISNFNVNWEGGSNTGFYDLLLKFKLKEQNTSISEEWYDRELVWKAANGISETKYKLIGKEFYVFFQNNLEANQDINREITSFDVIVRGVGQEFKEYTDILSINLGITSSQSIPTYTNMSNGYGIFSSINSTDLSGFYFHEDTVDSLKNGIYTKSLNFVY